jgi:nucleoside-diphosphate-sugar epimerase
MSQTVFLLGAGGYIGGSVAKQLADSGYRVSGLIRDAAMQEQLQQLNIQPVVGDANSLRLLQEQCQQADIVVNVADADNPFLVETILTALESTGKTYVHTSGSSIVATRANGEKTDIIFDETTGFEPVIEKQARVMINNYVTSFAAKGVRTIIICPAMVYGQGLGVKQTSRKLQLALLIELAQAEGKPLHIGQGENIWSHVHVADLAELYRLAIQQAPAGSFFYAENGAASMKAITEAIGEQFGLGQPQSWSIDEAIERWGWGVALFALGSNSRVSARLAKQALGWQPHHRSLMEEIRAMPSCG